MKIYLLIFLGFFASGFCSDEEVIRQLLQRWPHDFNAKNSQAVCGLFAPDLVASYPETKDRNYTEICRQLTKAMNDSNKNFHYEAPQIEQIIVAGDLAVVRLIWTLTISIKDQPGSQVIKEKGLDVFRRQKDGTWKIAISYAYPLS